MIALGVSYATNPYLALGQVTFQIVDDSALLPIGRAEKHSVIRKETAQISELEQKLSIDTIRLRIALNSPNSTTTDLLWNIARAESEFNPNAKNPKGTDSGLYQLTQELIDEQCPDTDPFDIKEATICVSQLINDHQLWRWDASKYDRKNYLGWYNKLSKQTKLWVDEQDILCSCLLYARRFLPNLPVVSSPAKLIPNTPPHIGVAVLLEYKIGGSHIAIITKWNEKGFWIREANFNRCKESFRYLEWSDSHIRGFYE